ncbi:alpha-1,6-glucosidase [Lysobacter arseniciresistens ZS79]|uniref:Alpha-1,6-glucosidase n=1 Tax=Lysobacter arseniciresistens ZS79 TaxID=913325 RepID=A0A0A0ETT3_9GAMM|nr:alpha-1,6-glucosidase [Lysobacter arseniciresistens ZS79]
MALPAGAAGFEARGTGAVATTAGLDTAACDANAFATTLHAAPDSPTNASAYWLDRGRLQWPGVEGGAEQRFRLYHSVTGAITFEPGAAVAGADGALALPVDDAPLPPTLAERFGFIGDGVRLSLADTDAARVPELLRGQLVLVREDADGNVLDATTLQHPGALDDLYAAAAAIDDLGATPGDDGTGFRLWAPTARDVSLCLYDDGSGAANARLPLQRDDATGAWSTRLPGDHPGRYYTYLVDVFVPGTGVVRNRVTDPYSTSLTTDSKRSYIADLDDDALKPAGWDGAPRPAPLDAQTDMVIYELHVRDFSRDDTTVSAANRGRYRAFTESDSDGMRHLHALADAGLTDVHLLPVFDLATVPEAGCVEPDVPDAAPGSDAQQAAVMAVAARDCFNWGYDPYHFNAPEGSFASDAADGAVRIREFRAMVQALHAAGLRVGMDVVYNHTTASGQVQRSVLDRIVPGYYQRLDAHGEVITSTCCDNTATEHLMMGKLMLDSVDLWAREYRIDSFRFDLMGHQPREVMEQLQVRVDAAAGRHVNLIGEGWNFGEVADGARFVQASQLSLQGSGIATFSDRARDAIRGGGAGDSGDAMYVQGYVNGLHYAPNGHGTSSRNDLLHAADLVRAGLAGTLAGYVMTGAGGATIPLSKLDYKGQPAGYAAQPGEVVNYVENHDNQTLFDVNALKLPADTSRGDRARVQVLALALNAFSQGVAYFHAGGELLRSKSLDRNSFDSGDWFNRLDWSGRDNHFGTGLPPAPDNRDNWPQMAPLLADPAIKPTAREIAFTRDAFLDLLRIRDSSTLFRLRTADDVAHRLHFHNTGPDQNPVVIAGELDGRGYPGARFETLLYLVNVSPEPQTLAIDDAAGRDFVLHPVHRAAGAADSRPRDEATFDRTTGRFTVPARTAVVYVIE